MKEDFFNKLAKPFAIVVLGIAAAFYYYLTVNPDYNQTISYVLLASLFALSLFLWFDPSSHLSAARLTRYINSHGIQKLRLTVTKAGVNSHSTVFDSHADWNTFARAIESEELFILIMKSNNFIIIPKRFLSTSEELATLRKLIKENILPLPQE